MWRASVLVSWVDWQQLWELWCNMLILRAVGVDRGPRCRVSSKGVGFFAFWDLHSRIVIIAYVQSLA